METEFTQLKVTSPSFENEGSIPEKYSCDGQGINPTLHIENLPQGAKSLSLIVEDPDAPNGTFDHWIVWNIDPVTAIAEDSNPGTSGDNSAGKTGFHPPCPPTGTHRYYFHVYALNAMLDLHQGAKKQDLQTAMKGHIMAQGTLMGTYKRSR